MPNPLDAITYNQEAGYLPINLVAGDNLSVLVTMPFVTTATNGGIVTITPDMLGMYFSTGIAYAITALSTTADTTAVAAGDVKVFMNYI